VDGNRSEQNFRDDHDWFRREGNFENGRGSFVPRRTAFGLPHSYSSRERVTGHLIGDKPIERRASPLMFHVHRTPDRKFFGVVLSLSTRFLPRAKVSINGRDLDYAFDASVLTGLLDGRGTAPRTGATTYLDSASLTFEAPVVG